MCGTAYAIEDLNGTYHIKIAEKRRNSETVTIGILYIIIGIDPYVEGQMKTFQCCL